MASKTGNLAKKKANSGRNHSGAVPMLEWMQLASKGYFLLMFGLFPIYFKHKYFDMGEIKFRFFRNATIIYAAIIAFLMVVHLLEVVLEKKLGTYLKEVVQKFTVVDWCVTGYLGVCVLSYLCSPFREFALYGADGWQMGLLSQVTFVFIYFCFAGLWRRSDKKEIVIWIAMAAAFFVMAVGVIMRIGFDPLGMYKEVRILYPEEFGGYVIAYLSTIGQASWYSSYLAVVLPIGIWGLWYAHNRWVRIACGIYSVVGFMTLVTQNTDSAYLALGAVLFLLFWKSMEDNARFLRFVEVLLVMLVSFKLTGILQQIFVERAVLVDRISTTLSRSNLTWGVCVGCLIIYCILQVLMHKTGLDIQKLKWMRIVVLVFVIVGAIGGVVYIVLNTMSVISAPYASDNNYLIFTDTWGNDRGILWKCSIGTFIHNSPLQMLIGTGPDTFQPAAYSFYAKELVQHFGEDTLAYCAHNEWLNHLITLGGLGCATYVSIFVLAFRNCIRSTLENPMALVPALCIISYMAHNVFCYQQVVCTPLIFIVIGIGQAMCSKCSE